MNSRLFLPAFLAASLANAQPAAPDAAPPKADHPPAAAEAKTEMQKWIEATDAQWQAAFKRDVTDVREAEVRKLMVQYLNLLEETIGKASKAGDLKGALALRDEQKRFGDTQHFPEEDKPDDSAAVKQARAPIRVLLAKLNTESGMRTKALHAKYDQVLAQAQLQLTQAKRLDDALLVQTKRDEVTAAWITPAVAIATAKTEPPVTPPPAVTPRPAVVQKRTGSLQERLSNSTWTWNGQETITLLPSGKAKWSRDGTESFTWSVTSETKRVVEGKTSTGGNYKLTFDAGLQTAKLWEGGHGERKTSRKNGK